MTSNWMSDDQRLLLETLRSVSHADAVTVVTTMTNELLDRPLLKPWTSMGFAGAADGLERHGHDVAAWAFRMLGLTAGDGTAITAPPRPVTSRARSR